MKQLKTVILTDEKFVALELRRSDGVKFQFAFDEPPALAFWYPRRVLLRSLQDVRPTNSISLYRRYLSRS